MHAPSESPLPDKARVEALAGFGLTASEIARVFGADEVMVFRAFGNEIAAGQIKANARVAESLYRKAIGEGRESVTAAIFWLKTRARWKETSVHEVVARQVRLQTMSDAEIETEVLRLNAQINAMIRPDASSAFASANETPAPDGHGNG